MSIGGAIIIAALIWAAFQPISARGLGRAFLFLIAALALFAFMAGTI